MAEPGVWLLPVIALVLGLAIQRGLAPLTQLSQDVHDLDVTRAAPLQARPPDSRRSRRSTCWSSASRRHCNASASWRANSAHELRTPLASLALHARTLRGAQSDAERAESLARLEHDSLRAGHVLPSCSRWRARAGRHSPRRVPVDLAELAGRVVADYAQPALDCEHELAFVGAPVPAAPGGREPERRRADDDSSWPLSSAGWP